MYYGSDPVSDGVYTHLVAIFLFFLCIIIFLYVYYYKLRLPEQLTNRAGNRHKYKQQSSKEEDSARKNVLRDYLVRTLCVDRQKCQLVQNTCNPIYEFEAQFHDNMNLVILAELISQKVSEHRGDKHAVYQFKIKGFTFGINDQETLKDYVRLADGGDENLVSIIISYFVSVVTIWFKGTVYCNKDIDIENLVIEAYCEFKDKQKGYQFQNIEDETLAQLVPKDQAKGFIKQMKPGALIQANCPDCKKRIIKKVQHYEKRTACFTLQRGINCPKCKHHVTDLLSPIFSECEYNYKGERENGKIIDNTEWKSVPPKKVLYWKEGDYHLLHDWINLRIFVRMFETRYCTACNQRIDGDDDDEIEERCDKGQCGHRYHPACFKQVSQGGNGYCAAEGCKLSLLAMVEAS